MNGKIWMFVVLFLLSGISGGFAEGVIETAAAPVVTVCPSGCDFTTLQVAVDAVSEGGKVEVSSGVYVENISITKGINITGTFLPSITGGFNINANNTIIQGFSISQGTASGTFWPPNTLSPGISHAGIIVEGDNITIHSNSISSIQGTGGASDCNNNFVGGGVGGEAFGIKVKNSNNVTITSNYIISITGGNGGITSAGGGTGGMASGIYLDSASGVVQENTLVGLTGGPGGSGGACYSHAGGGTGAIATGIYTINSPNVNVSLNDLKNVKGGPAGLGGNYNTGGGSGGKGAGIHVKSSSEPIALSNSVENCSGGAGRCGTIYCGADGIGAGLLVEGSSNGVFHSNNFTLSEYGARLESATGNILHWNNFTSNTVNAWDNGVNHWNSSYEVGGNYWDDYAGADDGSGEPPYHQAGDGIGDTLIPYNSSGNITKGGDYLPLLGGNRPPVINNMYKAPANPALGNTYWTVAEIVDPEGDAINLAQFALVNPSEVTVLNSTQSTNWNTNTWNSTSHQLNAGGTWKVYVYARSDGNSKIITKTFNFSIAGDATISPMSRNVTDMHLGSYEVFELNISHSSAESLQYDLSTNLNSTWFDVKFDQNPVTVPGSNNIKTVEVNISNKYGTPLQSYTGNITINRTLDGLIQPLSLNYTITDTAPTIDSISPMDIDVNEGETAYITPEVSDPDGDPVMITVINNNTNFTKNGNKWEWQTSIGNMGNYNITIIANDSVLTDILKVNIIVNKTQTAPIITILSPINNTNYNTTEIDLNWSVNQELDWAAFSLNGAENNTSIYDGGQKNVTLYPLEGLNQIILYANNSYGNMSSSSAEFRIDRTGPSITKVTRPDTARPGISYNITATIEDATTNVSGVNLTIRNENGNNTTAAIVNTENTMQWQYEFNGSNTTNGDKYYFGITAVDALGNKNVHEDNFIVETYVEPPPDPSGGPSGGGPSSTPKEICDDGKDNDGDKDIDCADSNCLLDDACAVKLEEPVSAPIPPPPETVKPAQETQQAPTGLSIYQRMKNPLLAVLLGCLVIAALVGYSMREREIVYIPKETQVQVKPKVEPAPVQAPVEKPTLVEKRIELPEHSSSIMQGLSLREQEIMNSLIEHGGETTQARIYHHTGLSTSALSRWVNALEQKGLIESHYVGKLRKVKLGKKFIENGKSGV
ncbi:MAG: hypothetical protein ABIG20_03005 [archaeon]